MLRTWGPVALASLLAFEAFGCTIVTTTGNGSPPPRPRTRRPPRSGRPAPPPPPRTRPSTPRPAPRVKATAQAAPQLPPQPPKTEPPTTPTRPVVLPSGTAAGRPNGFTPGAEPAYWIWQGPRGGWRVRTTTKNALHTFRGRITPVKTAVNSVSPSRTELRDRVWKNGNDWLFSFKTAGHADGITFTTRDNGCVKFDLQLDGGPVPKRIVVGKKQVSPTTNHFIVCPHGKKP